MTEFLLSKLGGLHFVSRTAGVKVEPSARADGVCDAHICNKLLQAALAEAVRQELLLHLTVSSGCLQSVPDRPLAGGGVAWL